MADEIQAVARLVEVGLNAIRLGGSASMKFIQLLMAAQHANIVTKAGEVSYESLMKHGSGETTLINIHTEDEKTLENLSKAMTEAKILYTPLPDLNPKDGFTQFLIDSRDIQKFTALMDTMTHIPWDNKMTHDEYVESGDPQKVQEIKDKAVENVKKNGTDEIPESQMKAKEQEKELFESYRKDENLIEISIDKETLVDRSEERIRSLDLAEDQFACRIPGTYGDNERFLVIPDTHVFEVSGEKKDRFVAFIPKDDMPDILTLESNKDLLENDVENFIPDETYVQSGEELIKKSFEKQKVSHDNTNMANGKPKFKPLSNIRAERGNKTVDKSEAKSWKEQRRRDDVFERTKNLKGTEEIRIDKSDLFLKSGDTYAFSVPGRPDSCYIIPADYIKDAGNGKHYRALIPQDKTFQTIDLTEMAKAAKNKDLPNMASGFNTNISQLKGAKLYRMIKKEQEHIALMQSKANAMTNNKITKVMTDAVTQVMKEGTKAVTDAPEKGSR